MTAFIESFSTDQLLPPWQSLAARTWLFVIAVDRGLIAQHLDTRFNAAAPDRAPFHYTPLPGKTYGLLCVTRHESLSSTWEHRTGCDTVSHTELVWTFPTLRYSVGADNLLHDPHRVWIQPFAFTDNSYVMFSAREIWGTEMGMAALRMAEGAAPADLAIDMAIEGMAKFDPHAQSQSIGCMRMGLRPTAAKASLGQLLDEESDLNTFVDILLADGIFTGSIDSGIGTDSAGMEINTLRQFRDVFDMDSAAYRAIVSSTVQHSNIRDLAFFSGANTVVEFLCSDSMEETLHATFGGGVHHPQSQLAVPPPSLNAKGTPPTNWDMEYLPIEVALGISYTADAQFHIRTTLHTYGQTA
ncbi:hypothetical protein [Novosphingobium sp.]|uniref:hypothetical protein n=1 Tax=Novosphingobium sp. TaxID=1874826 RepID=UPI0026269828|nr:hypothetical protein [Novosphingobium sp.]